jgi:hypothetical protein
VGFQLQLFRAPQHFGNANDAPRKLMRDLRRINRHLMEPEK